MKRVCIIGGAAVDITGRPDNLCRLRDSNLGRVTLSAGGVGHNVAKRLTAYDIQTELITAMGVGFHAQMIRDDCAKYGVGLTHALACKDAHTAVFLCILDDDGDLLSGISDMTVMQRLTPAYLAPLLKEINESDMVVLDGNLEPETLDYLTHSLTVPIFFDPVSCAKAARIGQNIGRCFAIKPNRFEAGFLSGKSCDTIRGVYRASDWFLEQGVQRVFISLSNEGVFWADKDGCGVLPAACQSAVNTTGAGDAMCGAIIHGCLNGLSSEQCAIEGNLAGARVCESAAR